MRSARSTPSSSVDDFLRGGRGPTRPTPGCIAKTSEPSGISRPLKVKSSSAFRGGPMASEYGHCRITAARTRGRLDPYDFFDVATSARISA
eukprot:5445596-Prymnesium_polylepis.2